MSESSQSHGCEKRPKIGVRLRIVEWVRGYAVEYLNLDFGTFRVLACPSGVVGFWDLKVPINSLGCAWKRDLTVWKSGTKLVLIISYPRN